MCLLLRHRSKAPFAWCAEGAPVGTSYPATGESGTEADVRVHVGALIVQVQGSQATIARVVPIAPTDRQK